METDPWIVSPEMFARTVNEFRKAGKYHAARAGSSSSWNVNDLARNRMRRMVVTHEFSPCDLFVRSLLRNLMNNQLSYDSGGGLGI